MNISLLTLNIMHGRNRKSAVFPLWLSHEEIERNLRNIADVIRIYDPDILTLQEVDQASVLSGRFNQFDFLNAQLNYPYKYFASSCSVILWNKNIFVSGNAIFSKYPLENCESYNFNFSFPTERKGFIIADAKMPDGRKLTIASVHLVWIDWMRFNSRAHQLRLLQQVISTRKNSAVIAGDFNCDL